MVYSVTVAHGLILRQIRYIYCPHTEANRVVSILHYKQPFSSCWPPELLWDNWFVSKATRPYSPDDYEKDTENVINIPKWFIIEWFVMCDLVAVQFRSFFKILKFGQDWSSQK